MPVAACGRPVSAATLRASKPWSGGDWRRIGDGGADAVDARRRRRAGQADRLGDVFDDGGAGQASPRHRNGDHGPGLGGRGDIQRADRRADRRTDRRADRRADRRTDRRARGARSSPA
jgi:hypothetical protein